MAKQAQDKIQSRGVGLKRSEWEELEKIAAELDMTPHAVAAYGIRYFIKHLREGKVKPQKRTTQSLPDL